MPEQVIISGQASRHSARQSVLAAPDGDMVVIERTTTLDKYSRGRVLEWIQNAAAGWKLIIRKARRSKEQSDKMWAMLTDIKNTKIQGRENYSTEQWKAVMMRSCGHEIGYLHDLNGEPFPYGYRSSKLKVSEMSDLIEYMYSFGADYNVVWSEENKPETVTRNKKSA